MSVFITINGPNLVRLGNFVERVSVSVIYIAAKRNKQGEAIKRLKNLSP